MFAATALSQPPETTAADDNAVALAHLGTRDDDDLARLRAGEATSLVLLTATALGLASRPITEPLEIPETRKAVRAEIFELNEFPQILLRVGWAPVNADALPSTPRWPLADVGDAVGRLGARVTESIRRRQLRNRNTSSRGRRGVAACVVRGRRDPHPNQHLGHGVLSNHCGDELTGGPQLGNVGHGAGAQARHRALQQDGRQHLSAYQRVLAVIPIGRQRENLRVVIWYLGAPLPVMRERKGTAEVYPLISSAETSELYGMPSENSNGAVHQSNSEL